MLSKETSNNKNQSFSRFFPVGKIVENTLYLSRDVARRKILTVSEHTPIYVCDRLRGTSIDLEYRPSSSGKKAKGLNTKHEITYVETLTADNEGNLAVTAKSANPFGLKSGFVKGTRLVTESGVMYTLWLASNKDVIKGTNGSENWIDYRLKIPTVLTSVLFQVCETASRNFSHSQVTFIGGHTLEDDSRASMCLEFYQEIMRRKYESVLAKLSGVTEALNTAQRYTIHDEKSRRNANRKKKATLYENDKLLFCGEFVPILRQFQAQGYTTVSWEQIKPKISAPANLLYPPTYSIGNEETSMEVDSFTENPSSAPTSTASSQQFTTTTGGEGKGKGKGKGEVGDKRATETAALDWDLEIEENGNQGEIVGGTGGNESDDEEAQISGHYLDGTPDADDDESEEEEDQEFDYEAEVDEDQDYDDESEVDDDQDYDLLDIVVSSTRSSGVKRKREEPTLQGSIPDHLGDDAAQDLGRPRKFPRTSCEILFSNQIVLDCDRPNCSLCNRGPQGKFYPSLTYSSEKTLKTLVLDAQNVKHEKTGGRYPSRFGIK